MQYIDSLAQDLDLERVYGSGTSWETMPSMNYF
jgi:hypothetical protein